MGVKRGRMRRHLLEGIVKSAMIASGVLFAGTLATIIIMIVWKGLPALSWEMISQAPKGGYFLGKGGGVLNAILGSLYLAGGATLLALVLSLPIALYLRTYLGGRAAGRWVRLSLDVLWGIPSIVYGAFGFTVMIALGLRASLLAGILVLALLEMPIMVRAMDEVMQRMPTDLEHAAFAIGTTRLEVALDVVVRQMLPGIVTAVLLAFGRGIGDAASVLFTAGYTDRLPTNLMRPVASLPVAVFQQFNTPNPIVQARGYASALILTIIVLLISIGSRWISSRLSRYTVK